MPWLTFHVIDYGLEIWNGTSEVFTKLIEDDHAAFLPEPSPRWVQYLEGSEIVTEGPNGAKHERFGFHAYAYPDARPQRLGAVRRAQRHPRALHAAGDGLRADHGRRRTSRNAIVVSREPEGRSRRRDGERERRRAGLRRHSSGT